jgi:hypothetical protein
MQSRFWQRHAVTQESCVRSVLIVNAALCIDVLHAEQLNIRVSVPGGGKTFLSSTASVPALEPTEPPTQWMPEALSSGVKRPGRQAINSTPIGTMFYECLNIRLRTQISLIFLHAQFRIFTKFCLGFHFQGSRFPDLRRFIIFCFLTCETMFLLHFVISTYIVCIWMKFILCLKYA